MGQTTEELYETIKDLKTIDEFTEEINNRKTTYEHLFDEETIALLIIDELGRNTAGTATIADLQPGIESTITGIITHIEPPRSFKRKNGSTGRVVNLELTDDTGSIRLVLWGEDVNKITEKTIQINTQLKIINGYTKKGYQGTEIHVGRWSTIDIIKKQTTPTAKQKKQQQNKPEITGIIQKITPTTVFFKDDGSCGFVAKLFLETRDGSQKITLWDDQVKHVQQYKKGEQIRIKNMDIKTQHGNKEIHVNGKAEVSRLPV